VRPGAAQRGFTLLEVLIVIAIIAVLSALSLGTYSRWRASSAVMDGTQQFSQRISLARTSAKRTNDCWSVSLVAPTSTTNTQYEIKRYSKTCPTTASPMTALESSTYTMPGGTILLPDSVTASSAINFSPPYGTTDSAPDTFIVKWRATSDVQRKVRLTSIFGKVVIK